MTRAILILIYVLTCTSAGGAQDSENKNGKSNNETKKFVGTWQVTKHIDTSGKPAPEDEIREFTFLFKEDKLVMKPKKESAGAEFSSKKDGAKSPKWLDLEFSVSGSKLIWLGIYRFNGDHLEICMAREFDEKPSARPSEFKASEKSVFFVLKRKQ